jgi:HEAT repeat protein
MLVKDEDAGVRTTAASCLGTIYEERRDRSMVKLLADILRNPVNDRLLREAAYSAMLEVIGYPPRARPSAARDLDFETEVDWQLVDQWTQ